MFEYATFSGGSHLAFDEAKFSGAEVSFDGATFSGGTVGFGRSESALEGRPVAARLGPPALPVVRVERVN